jgi:transposase-like protein
VVFVDGTFLTGKYRSTLMMAAAVDSENQIVPMAFALAEGENNSSWSWFMRLLRTQVLGASRTICLISDRHAGILNATGEDIEGFPPLVHRWCMRHFAVNFWRRQRKKEICDIVKVLCCVRTEYQFKETMRELDKVMNQAVKAWLQDQMEQKEKWALAYNEGGFRYNIMTTNSSESFNCVFTGVRLLPVSGIVEFSFMKCNEYFVKR